ncbi:BA75_01707T0 [Komagataella pastoris]|uniref:BA75_01707T0 n=1 Tax=Komagataella pastoris TaxID=4922 RepID=A0A1B2JA13_PICPA|nr:BA75_01707T0 [Komagataella pastoris]
MDFSEDLNQLLSRSSHSRSLSTFAVVPESQHKEPPLSLRFGEPAYSLYPMTSIELSRNQRTIKVPQLSKDKTSISKDMGYTAFKGISELLNKITTFVAHCFPPQYKGWSPIVTTDHCNSISKILESFVDESDVILVDTQLDLDVAHLLSAWKHNMHFINLNQVYGSEPNATKLSKLLENWKRFYPYKKYPKLLLTATYGLTGISQSDTTMKEVLKLANIYNFVVVETNTFPEGVSYLKHDSKGRVISAQSFRHFNLDLAFIIAHNAIVTAIESYAEFTTTSPSGMSQIIADGVLSSMDDWKGWQVSLREISLHYKRRRKQVQDALQDVVHIKGSLGNYCGIICRDNASKFAENGVHLTQGQELNEYFSSLFRQKYTIIPDDLILISLSYNIPQKEFSDALKKMEEC